MSQRIFTDPDEPTKSLHISTHERGGVFIYMFSDERTCGLVRLDTEDRAALALMLAPDDGGASLHDVYEEGRRAGDDLGFERGYTAGFDDGQAEERAMSAPMEPDDLTRDFIDDLQDFDHDFDPYAGQ